MLFQVGVICLVLFLSWRYNQTRAWLKKFPQKKGLPVLRNFFQVQVKDHRIEKLFTEWSKELGGVFAVQILNKSFIVLNSFEAIHEALVEKGESFSGRPQQSSFRLRYNTRGFSDLVFTNPSPRWKLMRKSAHRHIRMFGSGLKRIEALNLSAIKELVSEFRRRGTKPFDPRSDIHIAIMNIMTSLLVNRKYKTTDEIFGYFIEMEKIGNENLTSSGKGVELDTFPWLRFFGNSTFKKLEHQRLTRDKLWKLVKDQVMEDFRQGDKNQAEGLAHVWFKLIEEEPLVEELNAKMSFSNLIIAGTSTTSNSFYMFLNILSQHPDLQSKLQKEVDSAVGPNRCVSLDDKSRMPLTHATVLEILRYTTVVPLGIPHASLTTTSISGLSIPPGVQVLNNLWALHHDDKFWEAPYEFKPERFLDADGDVVSASHPNRKHLMPFGAGPRVCVGEVLAIGRIFLLVATTSQVFNVDQGPVEVSCDARDYGHGLVLTSEDFEIKVNSRNDSLYVD